MTAPTRTTPRETTAAGSAVAADIVRIGAAAVVSKAAPVEPSPSSTASVSPLASPLRFGPGSEADDAAAGRAIGLYAEATEGHAERVAATLRHLRAAAAAHPGRIVQATSLGAEDMVLTDLIARHRLPIDVATLQTGRLHPETVDLIGRIEAHYGLPVEVHEPRVDAVVEFVDRHGQDAMYASIELRKACCALRKLEPLSRMLADRDAWITGMRREQSAQRGGVPHAEVDDRGRAKFNPLADWSWADVWHYIASHAVPYNPLHDRFFPSIGCAPCTRATAVGEDFRAGRWWWEEAAAKECGLHVRESAPPPSNPSSSPGPAA